MAEARDGLLYLLVLAGSSVAGAFAGLSADPALTAGVVLGFPMVLSGATLRPRYPLAIWFGLGLGGVAAAYGGLLWMDAALDQAFA